MHILLQHLKELTKWESRQHCFHLPKRAWYHSGSLYNYLGDLVCLVYSPEHCWLFASFYKDFSAIHTANYTYAVRTNISCRKTFWFNTIIFCRNLLLKGTEVHAKGQLMNCRLPILINADFCDNNNFQMALCPSSVEVQNMNPPFNAATERMVLRLKPLKKISATTKWEFS